MGWGLRGGPPEFGEDYTKKGVERGGPHPDLVHDVNLITKLPNWNGLFFDHFSLPVFLGDAMYKEIIPGNNSEYTIYDRS